MKRFLLTILIIFVSFNLFSEVIIFSVWDQENQVFRLTPAYLDCKVYFYDNSYLINCEFAVQNGKDINYFSVPYPLLKNAITNYEKLGIDEENMAYELVKPFPFSNDNVIGFFSNNINSQSYLFIMSFYQTLKELSLFPDDVQKLKKFIDNSAKKIIEEQNGQSK